MLSWSWLKICKLAHALLWEYIYKWLKFAQRLGSLSYYVGGGTGHGGGGPEQHSLDASPPLSLLPALAMHNKTLVPLSHSSAPAMRDRHYM